MPSPNWSTTTPRAAWYYVRNAPGSTEFTRHYTTWMEIMRDARANLGVAPTPYAWNPTFTDAMERFLVARGASQESARQILAPVRAENARFDNKLIVLAIWAARFPNKRLGEVLPANGEQLIQASASPEELASIIYPQYAMQLIQGSNDPLVPNSTVAPDGGTGTTTGGGSTTGGGATTGGPGTKPPGGGGVVIDTGGGGKPPADGTGTTTGGGSTTGTTGGGTTGTTGGGTTTGGGSTAGGGTTTTPPTTTIEKQGAAALWQNWRIVLLVVGGIAVLLGAVFLVMRSTSEQQPRRLPANV